MKKILLCTFLLFGNAFAASTGELGNRADQFSNRGWFNLESDTRKYIQLENYSSIEKLDELKLSNESLLNSLESNTAVNLALFFPFFDLKTETLRLQLIDTIKSNILDQSILQEWSNFLVAMGEDRFEDYTENTVSKSGRSTLMKNALRDASARQIEKLEQFKNIAFKDWKLVNELSDNSRIGAEIPRMFQFLVDSRVMSVLMKSKIEATNVNSNILDKKKVIEILRSIITQSFRDNNGALKTSEFATIELEDISCFEKETELLQWNCQLDYVRNLFMNINAVDSSPTMVNNLILDRKFVKPYVESILRLYRDQGEATMTRESLMLDLEDNYFFLKNAFEIDPTLSKPYFKQELLNQILLGIDFSSTSRDILNLKFGKHLGELARYLELK